MGFRCIVHRAIFTLPYRMTIDLNKNGTRSLLRYVYIKHNIIIDVKKKECTQKIKRHVHVRI